MKKHTRSIAFLLAVITLLSSLPIYVFAEEKEVTLNGKCGENATYTLYDDGTLIISGKGATIDYFSLYGTYDAPWGKLVTKAIIEEGITHLGKRSFSNCRQLTEVSLPKSLRSIGDSAFEECSALTSVSIPHGITALNDVFRNCTSLTDVYLPSTVTGLNNTFSGCSALEYIKLPEHMDSLLNGVFSGCRSLKEITVSAGRIGIGCFDTCTSLEKVTFINSSPLISERAFYNCPNLKTFIFYCTSDIQNYHPFLEENNVITAYYPEHTAWPVMKSGEKWGGYVNFIPFSGMPSYFEEQKSITGLSVSASKNLYLFTGDSKIYNISTPDTDKVGELTFLVDQAIYDHTDFTFSSSNEEIFSVFDISCDTLGNLTLSCEAKKPGSAILNVKNKLGEELSFSIAVSHSNSLTYDLAYNKIQYTENGKFYNASALPSDSIDFFFNIANEKNPALPSDIESAVASNIAVIKDIELTLTISGEDLSFFQNQTATEWKMTISSLSLADGVNIPLKLFPQNSETFDVRNDSNGREYTLSIQMSSPDLPSVYKESFNFTVKNALGPKVEQHIEYINSNNSYSLSKQNIYGKNAVQLKGSWDYNLSKYLSFDFDNYYELFVADLMVNMYRQTSLSIDGVATYIDESLDELFECIGKNISKVDEPITDADIKRLKENFIKYGSLSDKEISRLTDEDLKKELQKDRQMLNAVLSDKGKLYDIFSQIGGETSFSKYIDIADFSVEAYDNIVNFVHCVSAYDIYKNASEEAKSVLRSVYSLIPEEEKKLKEAVATYINHDASEKEFFTEEVWTAFFKSSHRTSFEVLKLVLGDTITKSLVSGTYAIVGRRLVEDAAGKMVPLSSTAGFKAALSNAMTSVAIVEWGLFLIDAFCNTGNKYEELSKLIAVSEFSPYVVEALKITESTLKKGQGEHSLLRFHEAFYLHKSVQSYITNQTTEALKTYQNSLPQIMLGRYGDYKESIAAILIWKGKIDSLNCCSGRIASEERVVINRVISIRCPVDVVIYRENGTVAAKIENDIVAENNAALPIAISESEKYIGLLSDEEYRFSITAREEGLMSYSVSEADGNGEIVRVIEKKDIPLYQSQQFTGTAPKETGILNEALALKTVDKSGKRPISSQLLRRSDTEQLPPRLYIPPPLSL